MTDIDVVDFKGWEGKFCDFWT